MLKIRLNNVIYDPLEEQYNVSYSFIGDNIKYNAGITPIDKHVFELKEIIQFLAMLYRVNVNDIQLFYKNKYYTCYKEKVNAHTIY